MMSYNVCFTDYVRVVVCINEGGHICGHTCAMVYMWKSEDNSVEPVSPLTCRWIPGMKLSSAGLDNRALYLLSHLTGHHLILVKNKGIQLSTKERVNCGLCSIKAPLV